MKKILPIWVCFVLAINTLTIIPVTAVDTIKTPANEFPEAAPLLITAYQTVGAATSLAAVEVYNQADEPVDMACWTLDVVTKEAITYQIPYTSTYSGVLLPGEHTTISAGDTTYQLQPSSTATITTIELHCGNYRAVTATVKDTSDMPFARAYTATGYSTATQPFTPMTPPRVFYDDGLYKAPAAPTDLKVVEVYPYASDCAPNDASILCGDYVKLQNMGKTAIELDDLVLRTDYYGNNRASSNTIALSGTLAPGAVLVVDETDDGDTLSLTNSGGYVWLEDAWGLMRYDKTMQQYQSAGSDEQGYAYTLDERGEWQWTTTPWPTGQNIITAPVVVAAECPAGKYRNPETGRCRTIEEAVNALTECEEGYERNPATNRCRKAGADAVPEAAFPVTPAKAGAADAAGWYALAIVAAIAIGYGVWEWRAELGAAFKRLFGVIRHSK